jgi:translation initiation factor 2 subunit 1
LNSEPETVLAGLSIEPKLRDELLNNIRHRLTSQPIKLRADVDMTCYTYPGIEAIKTALKKAQIGDGDEQVKVCLFVCLFVYLFICLFVYFF